MSFHHQYGVVGVPRFIGREALGFDGRNQIHPNKGVVFHDKDCRHHDGLRLSYTQQTRMAREVSVILPIFRSSYAHRKTPTATKPAGAALTRVEFSVGRIAWAASSLLSVAIDSMPKLLGVEQSESVRYCMEGFSAQYVHVVE